MQQIFHNTPNWVFTEADQIAQQQLSTLQENTITNLPSQFFSEKCITFFQQIKKMKLYQTLKTLPKGVLHHVHFDCCEDADYYREHVVNDPIVYLNKELTSFCLGTKQEAVKNGWVTMNKVREIYKSEQNFINRICNLTMLNSEDASNFCKNNVTRTARWELFEQKITNFFPILGAQHLFRKYVIHCLRKFVKNGYDRIQYRSLLTKLTEYDQEGNIVCVHPEKRFMEVVDEAVMVVQKEHPLLTVDFIFFGLKQFAPQVNEKVLTTALEQKWDKTIGIDFVQEEDPFGDLTPYDQVANKVLSKFPELNIKKVYHAGETLKPQNFNIEVAINAGSARIGHAINIFQHPHLISILREKQICVQKCPIAYILLLYFKELRQEFGSMLQGLGVPITINPDDPGKFGYEDCTMDYFFAFVCYNWSLKNLKLLGYHSINHAICPQVLKQQLIQSYNKRWDAWINSFINM